MKKHWFQPIKEHACVLLKEEHLRYHNEQLQLQPNKLYFVAEGCVIVRSKEDKRILYLVRSRGCLNMEELIAERYDYEYVPIKQTRLLTIPTQKMHQLLLKYPKLLPRLLRHEHYILDQMMQFAALYREGCQKKAVKALYDRLHPPFSYADFEKYVNDDILITGDSHDIECQ